MTPPLRVDVAVVGGGPAGAAAALELSRLGARVAVIDRGLPRRVLGETLPPAATPLLQHLCLWERFLEGGHLPAFGNRSSWGSAALEETDFIRSPFGQGWHLDRLRLDAMLELALDRAGVAMLSRTRVLGCELESGRWTLTLRMGDDRREIEAGFVVDASGRARQLSRMLAVPRRAYDGLIGIVGVLSSEECEVDPDSFTQVEAMPDGWWFASLLPDGRVAAGYMTDADDSTARAAGTEQGWWSLLNRTIHLRKRVRTRRFRLHVPVSRVAAESSRLEQVAGDVWCAVGDAACAFDPLSSQGIASALGGGIWAARAIAGEAEAPAEYEEGMRRMYARYLAEWLGYYALERRWEDRPFWQRRHRALEGLIGSVG